MMHGRIPPGGRRGFALAEMLVVILLCVLLMSLLLAALLAYQKRLIPGMARMEGRELPVAPSLAPYREALELHRVLVARLGTAVASYVYGGRHVGLARESAEQDGGPLAAESLPVLSGDGICLAMDAAAFHELHATALGGRKAEAGPGDCSVLVLGRSGGRLAAVTLVQSESRELPAAGAEGIPHRWHRVRLWDIDEGPRSYEFMEPVPASAKGQFTGVVHTWYRHGPERALREEGPACVVFPDPWLWAGDAARPSHSRFSYLIPVSP